MPNLKWFGFGLEGCKAKIWKGLREPNFGVGPNRSCHDGVGYVGIVGIVGCKGTLFPGGL